MYTRRIIGSTEAADQAVCECHINRPPPRSPATLSQSTSHMLWPVVLPFKITFWLFATVVVLATVFAPALNWNRVKTFWLISLLCFLAFIPSCAGIMAVIDSKRFGVFRHSTYGDVNDFRIERYLPLQAKDITLEKYFSGHRAKYSISESELKAYLDGLWGRYGQYSAISRDELDDGVPVSADAYEHVFADLDWPLFDGIKFHSPVQSDGGGATYYFDPASGTAYHRARYW